MRRGVQRPVYCARDGGEATEWGLEREVPKTGLRGRITEGLTRADDCRLGEAT